MVPYGPVYLSVGYRGYIGQWKGEGKVKDGVRGGTCCQAMSEGVRRWFNHVMGDIKIPQMWSPTYTLT